MNKWEMIAVAFMAVLIAVLGYIGGYMLYDLVN